MESTNHFQILSLQDLSETNGGSFAYDLGRALRFYAKMYTSGIAGAYADWVVTDAVNDVLQE